MIFFNWFKSHDGMGERSLGSSIKSKALSNSRLKRANGVPLIFNHLWFNVDSGWIITSDSLSITWLKNKGRDEGVIGEVLKSLISQEMATSKTEAQRPL